MCHACSRARQQTLPATNVRTRNLGALHDCGQAVGHHKSGAPRHRHVQSVLHQLLALGIQGSSGLIQHQDLRPHRMQ